jgi:iron complex outermembrane receptor protein
MEEPITAAPEQQLFIGGTWRLKKFALSISVQHIHDLYTQTSPELITESYTLLNSKISYTFNRVLDVFAKGENLTDTNYYINYGYPMPGILFFGGINLHL